MFLKKAFYYALALSFVISYGPIRALADAPTLEERCEFVTSVFCDEVKANDMAPLSNDVPKREMEGILVGSGN